ncbi:MAG: InlB B-repeat-containing protein [Metamycoplasmataceae bacterium]
MKKNMKKMALGVMATGAFLVPLAVVSCGSSTADEVTDFIIEAKNNPKVRTTDIDNNQYKEYKTLSKVFEGLDYDTLNYVNALLVKGDVSKVNKDRIVLMAKVGYTIKGQKSITSEEFTPLPTIFEITPKPQITTDITSSELLNINNIDFLKKLFEGIEYDDLDNMGVSLSEVETKTNPKEYTITLTAKGEFHFNVNGEEVKSIASSAFTTNDLNLNITIKDKPEILKVDIENDNYKSFTTLQKLFVGLTDQNLKNIEAIEINNDDIDFGKEYLVTLIAADGYKINGRHTLVSNEFILPNVLNIKQVTTIPEDITQFDLKKDGVILYKELAFLQKIFTNINEDDLEHIEIEIISTIDNTSIIKPEGSYVITLKIKDNSNFVFLDQNLNEVKQITSEIISLVPFDYEMSIIENPVILAIDVWDNKYKELSTLEKLFIGITQEILNNLQVEITGSGVGSITKHRVVLLANDEYSINGNRTLVSDDFTLQETKNIEISIKKQEEITDSITNLELQNPNLSLLEKLFGGEQLTTEINNFDIIVEYKELSGRYGSIILKSKAGYLINGKRTIESSVFQIETILDITPNDEELVLSINDIKDDSFKTFETLNKLFNGLDINNFENFTTTIDHQEFGSASTHKITLTANEWFNFGENKMISKEFNLETMLDINAKLEEIFLSINDVKEQLFASLPTLQKLFNGLDNNNSSHIEVSIDDNKFGSGTTHTITLTTKDGFTFGGWEKTISKTFTLETILNITPNDNELILSGDDVSVDPITLATLQKLFNGLDNNNSSHIEVSIDNTDFGSGTTHTITLTTKDGFIFANGLTSIPKTFTLETILNITPNDNELILSGDDVKEQSFLTLETLQKLFNGLDDNNSSHIEVSIDNTDFGSGTTHTITLTTKDGFTFGGWEKTISKTFTLETILNITPITLDSLILSKLDVTTNLKTLYTLSRLFNNISDDDLITNIKNVKINGIITNTGSKHTITLEAKPGFIFANGGKEITSNEFTLETILNITPNDNELILSEDDVKEQSFLTLETLQKLFNGLDDNNSSHIGVSIDNTNFGSGTTHTITLITKNGYVFANGLTSIPKTFTLETILNITPNDNELILSGDDVSANPIALETLSKLFDGLTQDDIVNMIIKLNGEIANGSKHTITLEAKPGFIFANGGKEITSNEFSLLSIINITKVENDPKNINHLELKGLGYKSIHIIEKLFTGIKATDLNFIVIEIDKHGELDEFVPYEDYEITIKTMEGYKFRDNLGNETTELVSIKFRTVDVILDISASPNPLIKNTDITPENLKQITTLEKLFIGVDLDEKNLQYIDYIFLNTPDENGGNFYTVTLGFKFGFQTSGSHSLEIISNEFVLKTIINIEKRKDIGNAKINHLDLEYLLNFDGASQDIDVKVSILAKLFIKVNVDNVGLFKITTLTDPTPGKNDQSITLTANDNYTFLENGDEVDHITSNIFTTTETLLTITHKIDIPNLSISDISGNKFSSEETLTKLFNDVNLFNINNMEVSINDEIPGSATTHTITLRAKHGYVFENGLTSISKTFTLEDIDCITPNN